METTLHVDHTPGKVKKRYRKKKTKLEEVFPSYLQVPLTHSHTRIQANLMLASLYRKHSLVKIYLIGGGGLHQGPWPSQSEAPTNQKHQRR